MYQAQLKEAAKPRALPKVAGYKLLIAMPQLQTKTAGGIHLPDDHIGREALATIVGSVIEMGPDAYTDKEKFPTGPYCKTGDWVIFRSYAGTRFKIGDQEFRIVNDDTVEGTVPDPRVIERA